MYILYISNLKSKPENCVSFVVETLIMILFSSVRSIEEGRGQCIRVIFS
jgi:hypothetical protein